MSFETNNIIIMYKRELPAHGYSLTTVQIAIYIRTIIITIVIVELLCYIIINHFLILGMLYKYYDVRNDILL